MTRFLRAAGARWGLVVLALLLLAAVVGGWLEAPLAGLLAFLLMLSAWPTADPVDCQAPDSSAQGPDQTHVADTEPPVTQLPDGSDRPA